LPSTGLRPQSSYLRFPHSWDYIVHHHAWLVCWEGFYYFFFWDWSQITILLIFVFQVAGINGVNHHVQPVLGVCKDGVLQVSFFICIPVCTVFVLYSPSHTILPHPLVPVSPDRICLALLEWWRGWIQVYYLWYIIKIFVCKCHNVSPSSTTIKDSKKTKEKEFWLSECPEKIAKVLIHYH
jgi:hypothetical protein